MRDRVGDDDVFQARSAKLIGAFYVLVRVALLHRMDNQATKPAVARLLDALEAFHRDVSERAALQFVADAVYVNRRLVHTDLTSWEQAQYLAKFFARMRLAEIELSENLDEAALRAFVQAVRDVTLDETLAPELHAKPFAGIRFRDLDARGTAAADTVEVPDRFRVLRAYGLLFVTLRELLERVREGAEQPRIVPVRRAMQELVWLPERTRGLQLALLELGVHRDELAGRLAYVGLLSARMARRAGLSASWSRDVGVAAALAGVGRVLDIRYANAPPDVLARSNAFAGGARALLAASGRGRHAALRLIAAAEQESRDTRKGGHPVSRITAAAAAYERLTHTPPIGLGMPTAAALEAMLQRRDLDGDVVRLLAHTMGFFPPGSLVKLDTGEIAVVRDAAPSDAPRCPPVFLICDANGQPTPLRPRELVETGQAIAATVDARSAGLNPTHYLFS